MMRILLVAGAALSVSACSGLSSSTKATVTYQLRAEAPAAIAATTGATPGADPAPNRLGALTLRVLLPVAGPGLGSDAIMLTGPDHRFDRYLGSRWAAPAPDLLASLAVETLRSRATFAAVHDDAAPFSSDYILRIAIRRFDADYGNNSAAAPRATVTFDCSVGTRGERKLLASFTAEARVQADDNRMSAVVAAFELAARAALGKVAEQTIAAVSVDTVSN
jgi:cholesterol transport system auxiliary component